MFAPVTRVELDAALGAALEPIRHEFGVMRRDIERIYRDIEKLYGAVGELREHFATKADVEAMGRRIVMWVGGLLAVFVALMGWLVGRI